jgi:hypothetical protein
MWTGISGTDRGGVTGYTDETNPVNPWARGYVTPIPQPEQAPSPPVQPVYGIPNFNYTPSTLLQNQLIRANQQFNGQAFNQMQAPIGWNNAPSLSVLPKLSYESQGQQAPALSNGGLLGNNNNLLTP